jgi:hypothetical protein
LLNFRIFLTEYIVDILHWDERSLYFCGVALFYNGSL